MYIRNAWCVIAWSDEISRENLNPTVLGEDAGVAKAHRIYAWPAAEEVAAASTGAG